MATEHDNPAFVHEEHKDTKPPPCKAGKPSGPPLTQEEIQRTQFAMTKDICFVSFGFFLLFTSYFSMQNLQSSINPSLGTISLSVIYASMVVSSSFVPTWLLKKLGVKKSIAACMLCYTSYIAAQFYPVAYTLIPTAIILGLGASPLWSAKCTYLTHVGNKYAELTGSNPDVVITRFFGIFFLFLQSTQVVGNLISSTVLAVDSDIKNASDSRLEDCGVNFRQGNVDSNTSLVNEISDAERYTMAGIYLVFALVSSFVIILFVSPLTKYGDDTRVGSSTGRTSQQQVMATFRHMTHPYQLLIAPLTIWSGVEQAFIATDFTAAYVSCGLGVHMVGYTMICFGLCDAICSYFCSFVVKKVGRIPVLLAATLLTASQIVVLLLWRPSSDQMALFFVIPSLWGVADAVWQTQTNALYGVLFPKDTEAAFSNYKLFESLGYIIALVSSTQLYVDVMIYILIFFLSTGIAGYLIIEYKERKIRARDDGSNKRA